MAGLEKPFSSTTRRRILFSLLFANTIVFYLYFFGITLKEVFKQGMGSIQFYDIISIVVLMIVGVIVVIFPALFTGIVGFLSSFLFETTSKGKKVIQSYNSIKFRWSFFILLCISLLLLMFHSLFSVLGLSGFYTILVALIIYVIFVIYSNKILSYEPHTRNATDWIWIVIFLIVAFLCQYLFWFAITAITQI